jgi:hypothetical protein
MTPLPTVVPVELEPGSFASPSSCRAERGVWYEYQTGHCGLYSPIDFDGSVWIPVAVSNDPRAHANNATTGRVGLVDDSTLLFETDDGFSARLVRHDGRRWPWGCM